MRKLQIKDAEIMRLAIQQEIERSDESRYDHRLHGVLLVASGHSCGEVAQLFAEGVRTVQRCVKRFELKCSRQSKPASTAGEKPTLCCANFAALFKTLCLAMTKTRITMRIQKFKGYNILISEQPCNEKMRKIKLHIDSANMHANIRHNDHNI